MDPNRIQDRLTVAYTDRAALRAAAVVALVPAIVVATWLVALLACRSPQPPAAPTWPPPAAVTEALPPAATPVDAPAAVSPAEPASPATEAALWRVEAL